MSNIFPDAGRDLLRAQLELSVARADRLSGQLRGAEFERDLIKSKLSALVEAVERIRDIMGGPDGCGCEIAEIRAIVERAVGGES